MTAEKIGQPEQSKHEWKTEPPESFLIEFCSPARLSEGLLEMGFRFASARPDGEDKVKVTAFSTSGDGTGIEITIIKGDRYRSPKEIALERSEEK